MKQLIFIDNDRESVVKDDFELAKDFLESDCQVPESLLGSMKAVFGFWKLSKDSVYELLFSPENIICTFSMYTATHLNSLHQMMGYLQVAGRNRVKGIVYIDSSGMILDALNNNIDSVKSASGALDIIRAVEGNFIITRVFEPIYEAKRVRVFVNDINGNIFGVEDFDVKTVF